MYTIHTVEIFQQSQWIPLIYLWDIYNNFSLLISSSFQILFCIRVQILYCIIISGYNFNLFCNCIFKGATRVLYIYARIFWFCFSSNRRASSVEQSHRHDPHLARQFPISLLLNIYCFLILLPFLKFIILIVIYSRRYIHEFFPAPRNNNGRFELENSDYVCFFEEEFSAVFLSPSRFEQNGKNNFVSRENGWNGARNGAKVGQSFETVSRE